MCSLNLIFDSACVHVFKLSGCSGCMRSLLQCICYWFLGWAWNLACTCWPRLQPLSWLWWNLFQPYRHQHLRGNLELSGFNTRLSTMISSSIEMLQECILKSNSAFDFVLIIVQLTAIAVYDFMLLSLYHGHCAYIKRKYYIYMSFAVCKWAWNTHANGVCKSIIGVVITIVNY